MNGRPSSTGASADSSTDRSVDAATDTADRPTALLVVGTRPELVKMAPVCRALSDADWRVRLVHTGQHYDEALSDTFFETLGLPTPETNLGVGSGSHAAQTARTMVGVERLLDGSPTTDANSPADADPPTVVLAQGDTNAVVGTALATCKTPVPFAHVEAGLRSGDRAMPEEVNRIVADQVADLLFAPTDEARDSLRREGVADRPTQQVHVTGNTVVDACLAHRTVAERESSVLAALGLTPGEFVLATIHRPRNTDDHPRLRRIVGALDGAPFPVVLPAHPRTRRAMESAGIRPTGALRVTDPLDYLDFLRLLDTARVVVTDSGGVQEEASALETPCLTVRPHTERPETVAAGVNELVSPAELAGRLRTVFETDAESMVGATDLYGDGRAGERIVGLLSAAFGVDSGRETTVSEVTE
ncbi:non-hydrolyzing UDP-N-acetylglucosamine 2-epimerase [Salinirubrum litoreum]|uniref:Non-hydrolyzing UDP-N-acetylglucosamine 2-epimerase n=1 Tax=Salinirubrum litoreum TaxID=1126234 RepID=A0ABD5RE40_9EURY|nr:UDP-N-acetylglucosamine 2-epimerase (non-hydrolyzing) [Salinirubrum litoreum]